MKPTKELKVQRTRTNQHINIPIAWLDFLNSKQGDIVIAELDVKKSQIVLKFKKQS